MDTSFNGTGFNTLSSGRGYAVAQQSTSGRIIVVGEGYSSFAIAGFIQ
jgi:hypothetical protein